MEIEEFEQALFDIAGSKDINEQMRCHIKVVAEFNHLTARVAELEAVIDASLKNLAVNVIKNKNGVANDFMMQHPLFALFQDAIVKAFIDAGSVNYLETGFSTQELGNITCTVQKVEGKTPSQIIQELKAENARLRELHRMHGPDEIPPKHKRFQHVSVAVLVIELFGYDACIAYYLDDEKVWMKAPKGAILHLGGERMKNINGWYYLPGTEAKE